VTSGYQNDRTVFLKLFSIRKNNLSYPEEKEKKNLKLEEFTDQKIDTGEPLCSHRCGRKEPRKNTTKYNLKCQLT
jgi:hypothetical protein